MRIDRYIHDERFTWGAAFVLLSVASLHAAGIASLLTVRPPHAPTDANPLFQVSLERLPPPPLPRAEEPESASGLQDDNKTAPRKTRPVPIIVDTPTTNPVPPDTQVKKYAMGDELLEGEPGPPSPPGAEVGGTGTGGQALDEPIAHSKVALLRMKPPIYPPRCLRMGVEGLVKVRVLVGEDGSPQEITLSKSSGDSALDEAALSAVRDWIFVPAMRNGLPARAWAVVPIEFKLIN